MKYSLKTLYQLYYCEGNLLSQRSTQESIVDVEYPDGSKFRGKLAEGSVELIALENGEYTKKSRFNNSYYKSYTGSYRDGVPHGKDGKLEIRLTAWPRYHTLIGKFSPPPYAQKSCCCTRKSLPTKSKRYRRTVKYLGEFTNGQLDGEAEVVVEDKLRSRPELTTTRSYKTLFQNGLELPQSK